MPELDTNGYLEHGLPTDRTELVRVRTLIDETAATLVLTRTEESSWPYLVDTSKPRHPVKSASTDSMIAFALAAAAGTPLQSPLAPTPAEDQLGSETADALGVERGSAPRERVRQIAREAAGRVTAETVITSNTYGPNDPFTLSWLVPVADALEVEWSRRDAVLDKRLSKAWKPARGGMRDLFTPPRGTKPLPHAFPLLRVLHLTCSAEAVRGPSNAYGPPPELADEFLAVIHRQLANRQVDDASFDPAELIFALEGLLRSPAGEPSEALIDQVFEDLGAHQEHSPSWRPLRPFLATSTGLALLPLSVEGASALARICREIDERSEDTRRFSRHVDLFRKYVQWLEGQRVEIILDGAKLKGWHSEHVREPKTIYTWQTSQVLIFLLHYSQLLQRHIALQAVTAANLSATYRPKPRKKDEPPAQSWDVVRDAFVAGPGEPHKQNRSAVLYGPPGTGKTTLAKWLAGELRWSLITISPSDFMAQGTAAVEARAKAVFTALMQQRRAVVLFDEIDRLILDRDHPDYGKQEGAFQLMTPSMLTKLNDLRQAGEVIFLVATNYVERLDRAITRPGRFDKQLLISPPGPDDRKAYLAKAWKDEGRGDLPADHSDVLERLASRLWLATYAEMRDLVVQANDIGHLEDIVSRFQPATTLESYAARMGIASDESVSASDQNGSDENQSDEGRSTTREPARAPFDEVLALEKLYRPDAFSPLERRVANAARKFEEREEAHRRRRQEHAES